MDIKIYFSIIIYAITITITSIVTGIFVTINFCLLRPFSKKLYRKVNYYSHYTMAAQTVFLFTWFSTCDFKVYVDQKVYEKCLGKEHSLCVANHPGELDWAVLNTFFDGINSLGNTKYYIKNEVKYIPIIGWCFYCFEYVYLSRSYEKDKEILKKSAVEFGTYEHPIHLILSPEGTRFSAEKHQQSLKFSRERGLPELYHHLVPRSKGFTSSIPYMREKLNAVYNIQIAFEGTEPTILNLISAKHFNVHLYLERIPIENVPQGEEEQKQYLMDMFYNKDKLMDSFKKTGDFFELSGEHRHISVFLERRRKVLHNFLMWFTFSIIFLVYLISKLYHNGHYFYLSAFLGLSAFSIAFIRKLLDIIQMKGGKQEPNK